MVSTANAVFNFFMKILVLPLWLLNQVGIWSPFYRLLFPHILYRLAKHFNKRMAKTKRDLFLNVENFAVQKGRLTVLEIGCGTGANFQFYPRGTRVICVDRNPHFNKFLQDNEKMYPHLQLEKVFSPAEDMHRVADGSVDVVVATLVLCSVQNVQTVLTEVARVLKPGGAFYFLEHVAADPATWTYFFQHIFDPLWWYFGDGCSLTVETWQYLENSGFSDLKLKHLHAPLALPLVRPHILGYAVK